MGLRFQNRVTLFPGVRLNLSAHGISTTIGVRGASVNFGPKGRTLNLGIPGTGVSLLHHLSPGSPNVATAVPEVTTGSATDPHVAEKTSQGLGELRELVLKVAADRERVRADLHAAELELEKARGRLRRAQNWFLRIFLGRKVPDRKAEVEARAGELEQLEAHLGGHFVDADFGLDDAARRSFDALLAAFESVSGCAKIWDVTGSQREDRRVTRSSASVSVTREEVRFHLGEEDDVIQTYSRALRLGNADGADILIYPGLVVLRTKNDIALIDPREISIEFDDSLRRKRHRATG